MDPQRVRAQLDRILGSAEFSGAERPRAFLRYVVEQALDGEAERIKESVIAVEAFNRSTAFDSKTDPIVRVEAGRLRDRLKAYYDHEGQADDLLIELPKGGYAPRFTQRRVVVQLRADVLRLSVVLPGGSPVDSFAVSPDGRALAFAAISSGKQLLWVRWLDSLEAHPLPATDGATYPFWSPDSRSIGFFAQTKLKRVEVSGGPPREIADVLVGRGAAWSASGVIVFCPRPLGPLHAVPEGGGEVRAVTTLDQTRADAVHAFPQFLPDGRRFIFLSMAARAEHAAIRVASLDAPASKVLLQADTSALYARALPGMRSAIVFVSAGTLMAQRLDLERLQMEGERVVLARNVRYRRWYQACASVADDGALLYQQGLHERHEFAWLERSGALVGSVGAPNDAISFTMSPDERHVAFYRDSDPATIYPKVWAMSLARGGALFRATDSETPEGDFTPIWSADSRDILFSRGTDRGMRLLRQALTGGTPTCVLDTPGPKFPTDWSSDGRYVAFTSQAPDFRNLHVWIADLGAGSAATAFLNHAYSETSARFTPLGANNAQRFVAFASAETGRDEVYFCDYPERTHKWHVSTGGGLMPHWRDDARELFYLAPDGTLMAVEIELGSDVRIGAPRSLFATGIQFIPQYKAWMNQFAVARGGRRFLVNRPLADGTRNDITVVVQR